MRYLFLSGEEIKEKRKLRVLLISCFVLMLLCGIAMCVPTAADAEIYDNVIRFHVIANSDSDEDQSLKLTVRDAVIQKYSGMLSSYKSKEEAESEIGKKTDQISAYSEEIVKECGYDYTCQTFIDTEYYNRTEYESYTMPAGNYTSLRIVIGNGEGHNWWCVLFPPLCTKAALSQSSENDGEEAFIEAGFTSEQYKIITENEKPKYRLKFRLLELFFG